MKIDILAVIEMEIKRVQSDIKNNMLDDYKIPIAEGYIKGLEYIKELIELNDAH